MQSFLLCLNHYLEADRFRATATRYCNTFVNPTIASGRSVPKPATPWSLGCGRTEEWGRRVGTVGDGFSFLWSGVRLKSYNAGG